MLTVNQVTREFGARIFDNLFKLPFSHFRQWSVGESVALITHTACEYNDAVCTQRQANSGCPACRHRARRAAEVQPSCSAVSRVMAPENPANDIGSVANAPSSVVKITKSPAPAPSSASIAPSIAASAMQPCGRQVRKGMTIKGVAWPVAAANPSAVGGVSDRASPTPSASRRPKGPPQSAAPRRHRPETPVAARAARNRPAPVPARFRTTEQEAGHRLRGPPLARVPRAHSVPPSRDRFPPEGQARLRLSVPWLATARVQPQRQRPQHWPTRHCAGASPSF